MTKGDVRRVTVGLIEENPVPVRALIKTLDLVFSPRVPTLAITLEDRPVLRVNPDFVQAHCRSEREVAALVVHELLHVVLRQTQRFTPVTPIEHVAFDAVIHAIIHRTMGERASALMTRYHARAEGVARLLRPPTEEALAEAGFTQWEDFVRDPHHYRARKFSIIWKHLYEGRVLADDLRGLIHHLPALDSLPALLGNHDEARFPTGLPVSRKQRHTATDPGADARKALLDAIDRDASTDAPGVIRWAPHRRPPAAGSASRYHAQRADGDARRRWLRDTYAVLARHLTPKGGAPQSAEAFATLPVLSPHDPRATLRAFWNPLPPEARWPGERPEPSGGALVYLDAGGSMRAELPVIVALLGRFGQVVRHPYWTFTTVVRQAQFENGLLANASKGRSTFDCVLQHLAQHRPPAAVAITDGFVDPPDPAWIERIHPTRLHVLVTRDGSTRAFDEAGIPVTQLGKVPS